jgi:DNA-directed RNA polymerase specialized sigma24 family protein
MSSSPCTPENLASDRLIGLLKRYRAGDTAAYSEFDKVCRQQLCRRLRKLQSTRSLNTDTDEAIQDALITLVSRNDRFCTDHQLLKWLTICAQRRVTNSFRRRRPIVDSTLLDGISRGLDGR